MPAPTPGYVKNMIRRSLREIIDPSPSKEDEKKYGNFSKTNVPIVGHNFKNLKKRDT